ncbi:MAG: NAD-dependent epimerase/dehydratase family protein [Bacteroidetes bacterium]|nr:MAG: NAD-dependent epimerase/dehydratase family protein [Bacteroidota bacterium]TNF00599.1 MAG: NAD-dependent epimerase/dehydratase family protein [Bacteroidota bacterium]
MGKTAIILGATGLTGSLVLEQLLVDDRYERILLFSRSSCGVDHPKLTEYLGDLLHLEEFKEQFKGDEVYVCIGTTRKKTPDPDQYRKIDFGIPVQAAQLAKENDIKGMAVVSAIGADSNSSFKYNRIKGDMEKTVMEVGIPRTYILRPSMIAGDRKEHRSGERIGLKIFKALQFLFIGKLKKYKAVDANAIANKMIALLNSDEASSIIESDHIS